MLLLITIVCFFLPVFASDTPDYVLGSGDEIFVEVFDQTDSELLILYKETVIGYKPYDIGNPYAGNRYVLSYTGDLELPGLGKFKAKGKKIKDLEKEINFAALVFDKKPRTIINLLKVKTINIYVIGAVNNPGLHAVQEDGANNNIVSIIAKAGGYTTNSDRGQVIIESRGKRQIICLNDKERNNLTVPDNSYIFVPDKKDNIYILGEVKWAGSRAYHPALTVLDYLASAGGVLISAADEIYVINDINQDTTQNIKVKIRENMTIAATSGPIVLKPGATIYVPKNIFASWRDVFNNLILLRDTVNYPQTFNDATSYYIQGN